MQRRLYISDLDGTLLLSDKTLGEYSRQVVQRFVAAGGLFTVATGRSAASVAQILHGLDLPVEVIAHNGALTADLRTGAASAVVPLPGAVAADLFARAIARGLAPAAYALDRSGEVVVHHGARPNPPMRGYLAAVARLHRCQEDDGSRLASLPVLSLIILDEPGRISRLFAEAGGEGTSLSTSLGRSAYTPDLGVGEVQAATASKAGAAEELARRLGLTPAAIVAFGDNANDLPLLRRAGLALCPPSAVPQVLAVTPHRILEPAEEGVARYLETLIEPA